MRAWCLPKQVSIDSLSLETVADPSPEPEEVVLDVHHAALNPADRYLAEGLYPAKPTFPPHSRPRWGRRRVAGRRRRYRLEAGGLFPIKAPGGSRGTPREQRLMRLPCEMRS